MNSLERVIAAVKFQETDRTPVIAQVFGHAATFSGASVDDYVRDGETLAQCQLNAWKHYGYDAVFSVMDASVETEAVGSALHIPQEPVSDDRTVCALTGGRFENAVSSRSSAGGTHAGDAEGPRDPQTRAWE